jgi:hypothetical protein
MRSYSAGTADMEVNLDIVDGCYSKPAAAGDGAAADFPSVVVAAAADVPSVVVAVAPPMASIVLCMYPLPLRAPSSLLHSPH